MCIRDRNASYKYIRICSHSNSSWLCKYCYIIIVTTWLITACHLYHAPLTCFVSKSCVVYKNSFRKRVELLSFQITNSGVLSAYNLEFTDNFYYIFFFIYGIYSKAYNSWHPRTVSFLLVRYKMFLLSFPPFYSPIAVRLYATYKNIKCFLHTCGWFNVASGRRRYLIRRLPVGPHKA